MIGLSSMVSTVTTDSTVTIVTTVFQSNRHNCDGLIRPRHSLIGLGLRRAGSPIFKLPIDTATLRFQTFKLSLPNGSAQRWVEWARLAELGLPIFGLRALGQAQLYPSAGAGVSPHMAFLHFNYAVDNSPRANRLLAGWRTYPSPRGQG
jgi:hypothetical protein